MSKIYICDFHDSFTYNIFSILKRMQPHLDIEVTSSSRSLSFLQTLTSVEDKVGLILGAGPGHPKDYNQLNLPISKIIEKDNIFVLGICLGHQLILSTYGLKCEHCYNPIHGHVVDYTLAKDFAALAKLNHSLSVQRYNSLSIKFNRSVIDSLEKSGWRFHSEGGEVIIAHYKNTLSFQFHPESIGTSCPESFFTSLLEFLL